MGWRQRRELLSDYREGHIRLVLVPCWSGDGLIPRLAQLVASLEWDSLTSFYEKNKWNNPHQLNAFRVANTLRSNSVFAGNKQSTKELESISAGDSVRDADMPPLLKESQRIMPPRR